MLPTTLEAVKSILRADPSVSTPDRARLLAVLRNGGPDKEPPAPAPEGIIRRAETARRLAVSKRTVDKLALSGVLPKVGLPGRTRKIGFRESDVSALIAGKGG
jgi:predicted DNA-binding transcriptional regulator AlpA